MRSPMVELSAGEFVGHRSSPQSVDKLLSAPLRRHESSCGETWRAASQRLTLQRTREMGVVHDCS